MSQVEKPNALTVTGLVLLGVLVALAAAAVVVFTTPHYFIMVIPILLATGFLASFVGLFVGVRDALATLGISLILAFMFGVISLFPATGMLVTLFAILGYAAVVLFAYGAGVFVLSLFKLLVGLEARLRALEAKSR